MQKAKIKSNLITSLLSTVLLITGSVGAQQPTNLPTIGHLNASSLSTNVTRMEAFRRGLRDLSYVEGKNIGFVFRTTEGQNERYSDLAAELVRLSVDIVVGETPVSVLPRKRPAQFPLSC